LIDIDNNILVYAHCEHSPFHGLAWLNLPSLVLPEELWSADRDFNRFTGLSVVNPLL
jgi:hypothetical protein